MTKPTGKPRQRRFDQIVLKVTWGGEMRRVQTRASAWAHGQVVFEEVKADFLAGSKSSSGRFVEEVRGEKGTNYRLKGFRKSPLEVRHARQYNKWGYTCDTKFSTERPNLYIIAVHLLRAALFQAGRLVCEHGEHGRQGHVCEGIELVPEGHVKAKHRQSGIRPATIVVASSLSAGPEAVADPGEVTGDLSANAGAVNVTKTVDVAAEVPGDSPLPFLADRIAEEDRSEAVHSAEAPAKEAARRFPHETQMQKDAPLRSRGAVTSASGMGLIAIKDLLQDFQRQTNPVVLHVVEDASGGLDILLMKNWKGDEACRVVLARNKVSVVPTAPLPPSPSSYLTASRVADYFVDHVDGAGACGSDVIKDLGPWGDQDPHSSKEFGVWQDAFTAIITSKLLVSELKDRNHVLRTLMKQDEFGRLVPCKKNREYLYVVEETHA